MIRTTPKNQNDKKITLNKTAKCVTLSLQKLFHHPLQMVFSQKQYLSTTNHLLFQQVVLLTDWRLSVSVTVAEQHCHIICQDASKLANMKLALS